MISRSNWASAPNRWNTNLCDVWRPSERWEGADPPTLERVLFHLLQEYARHVGHLDVARELIDGKAGE